MAVFPNDLNVPCPEDIQDVMPILPQPRGDPSLGLVMHRRKAEGPLLAEILKTRWSPDADPATFVDRYS